MEMSEKVRTLWEYGRKIPGGKKIFSRAIGMIAPYSGNIKADILKLENGYCKAQIKDHRSIRNHLNCIHAVALINLGELTSGLAMLSSLPSRLRGIPTHLEIDYLKKSRGLITAECTSPKLLDQSEQELILETKLFNDQNENVALFKALWKISPA